jgi:hypothetical protein
MRASDPYALITPGKIYRALGKSAECGGCNRLFVEHMRCDEQMAVPTELPAAVPPRLRDLRRHSR